MGTLQQPWLRATPTIASRAPSHGIQQSTRPTSPVTKPTGRRATPPTARGAPSHGIQQSPRPTSRVTNPTMSGPVARLLPRHRVAIPRLRHRLLIRRSVLPAVGSRRVLLLLPTLRLPL